MLSYQHEYHAGNHADILKHIGLVSILHSLTQKEKPFTVIDSHASAGTFSLDDERIKKTAEAEHGIEKLFSHTEKNIPQAVERYLNAQRPYYKCRLYAGSPELTRLFLRKGDAHFAIELHPQALESLKATCKNNVLTEEGSRSASVKTHIKEEDSYKALKQLTPPLIKRGLVLVDPSYEDASDYVQVAQTLTEVHRKWNTAIIMLWYPLISRRKNETAQMLHALETAAKTGTNPCSCIRKELRVKDPESLTKEDGAHLYGSGLFVINEPWHFEEEMDSSIAFLQNLFVQD